MISTRTLKNHARTVAWFIGYVAVLMAINQALNALPTLTAVKVVLVVFSAVIVAGTYAFIYAMVKR